MKPCKRNPLAPPWNNPSATAEIYWPDGISTTCTLFDATVIWIAVQLAPAHFEDFTILVREPCTS